MQHRSLRIALALCLLGLTFCDSGGGGGSADGDDGPKERRTRTGTIRLEPEQGFVISTGEVVEGEAANVRSVDLVAYSSTNNLDVKPGEPYGQMRVYKTDGGHPRTFSSLDEVPELMSGEGEAGFLAADSADAGFAIAGNATVGAEARFRVLEVPRGNVYRWVELEYEAVWWE